MSKRNALMSLSTAETPILPPLPFTPEVEARTAHLYDRMQATVPPTDWRRFAPELDAIQRLKRERNAIVLAHNYQTPEIYHAVADIVGDSLALARKAVATDADVIVMAGVHFMAETAKLLNPDKTVLIPDMQAGCTLAASITGADVRAIKPKHPGRQVINYVNTTADLKAETDIRCTSANAVQVGESAAREWGVDKVILIPDEYLARNVARQTSIGIIAWKGRCEVHERFTAEDIADMRAAYPGAEVLAHPECPTEVIEASDFTGSTAAMADYVTQRKPAQGGANHRILHGRQRGGGRPGHRVRASVQPPPAHEAHHLAGHLGQPALRSLRGDGGRGCG